jgi:hypothetical protein
MYPKSEKPSLIPRPIKAIRGKRKEHSSGVARIAHTGSVLPPLNSSTPSTIRLPLAHNLATLGVQGSVSRTPTNKRQQPRSLRPTTSASRPAASASTPLDRDSILRSSIHPTDTDTGTAGGSGVPPSHDRCSHSTPHTMYPKSKKPSLIPRPIKSVRGGRKEDSPGVARIANTGSAVPPPLNSSTSSTIPLPLAHNLMTLGVQGSVSRVPTNKHQQPRSSRPTASAPRLAAPPIDPDPTPQSLIHPTPAVAAGGSLEAAASHDHHDRLPPPHPPQVPSLNSPPAVSVLERAQNFQMRDLVVSVFHAEPNPLEIRT